VSDAAAVTIEPPATGALPLAVEKPTLFMELLRPSSLPKLAVCPRYVPSAEAGPYAARGSKLDNAFRLLLAGEASALEGCTEEEQSSLRWAEAMTRLLSGEEAILYEKTDCRMRIPGLPHGGEADAITPGRFRSFDLKSGILREYREQMAAYAYGLMEKHFASEWTCTLLFLDLRQVVHMRFTYEEARGVVENVIAYYRDPESMATPGDACGWCALREVCQARRNLMAESLRVLELKEGLDHIKDDPEKLSRFLVGCKHLEDAYKNGKEYARRFFEGGGAGIPGFKLQTRKGNEFVAPGDVASALAHLKPGELCQLYGNLSAEKFRGAWADKYGAADPPDIIQAGNASTYVRAAPSPKEPKAKKTKALKNQ
jgi:CRISPR/Cas system-associated exonuclease Cas4 (RecB family)